MARGAANSASAKACGGLWLCLTTAAAARPPKKKHGDNLALLACGTGNMELLRLILARAPHLLWRPNHAGLTALHVAAMQVRACACVWMNGYSTVCAPGSQRVST